MHAAQLKRPFVIALLAGGWLSILGNSPGSTYHFRKDGESGPTKITPVTDPGGIKALTFSAPVMRVYERRRSDGMIVGQAVCTNGMNCLTSIPWLPSEYSCRNPSRSGRKDASPDIASTDGATDGATDADGATADAMVDGSPLGDAATEDASVDARDASIADAANADARDAAAETGARLIADHDASTSEGEGNSVIYRCPAGSGGEVEVRVTGNGHVVDGPLQIVVETADGTKSTLEYHYDEEEPKGYFGC